VDAELAGDAESVLLMITCSWFEANFWIPLHDLAKFKLVRETLSATESIPIGHSAGAQAFWSRGEAGLIMVVIGADDESWDIGFGLPETVFKGILIEAKLFLDQGSTT
jgi:hypothetical protein